MRRVWRYVVGIFFFGLFLAAGLYGGYSVATQLPLALESEQWPTTQGRIVESRLRKRQSKKTRHSLLYSYEVDGRYFDGKRITFMGQLFRDSPENTVQRYPRGNSVAVHYSPDSPEISVLETGVWWLGFVAAGLISLAFTAFAVAGLRTTFR